MRATFLKVPFVLIQASLVFLMGLLSFIPHLADPNAFPLTLIVVVIVHLVLTFIGSIPALRLSSNSRNEIDRILLPPYFLSLTLLNVFTLASFAVATSTTILPFSLIGKFYTFALAFSSIMPILIGLFHVGINKGRLVPYLLLTFLASILIAKMVPLSVALNPTQPHLWFPSSKFLLVPVGLGVIALVTFIFLYLREPSRQSFLRLVSFIAIVLANIIYILATTLVLSWVALVIFALGIVLSIPNTKFTQYYT